MTEYEKTSRLIAQAVEKYSSNGDKSLEYIGITTDFNEKTDLKVYRLKSSNGILLSDIPECVVQFSKKIESENPDLRFFDFSLRTTQKSIEIYSVSFLVTSKSEDADIYIPEEARKVMSVFDKKKNPCIQKGYLIDNSGNIIEEKIYYTLNSDEKLYTWKRRFEYLTEKKHQIIEYMKEISGVAEKEFAERLFELSCIYGYRLFMMGINKSESYCNNKLYFVYDQDKDNNKQLKESLSLVKELCGDCYISKIIEFCNTLGLLLKGFACGVDNCNLVWRFYFALLK